MTASGTHADRGGHRLNAALAVGLTLFTLAEVNYPRLGPQAQLAIFATLGLILAFRAKPLGTLRGAGAWIDRALILASCLVGIFIVVQSEPFGESFWLTGQSLGDRAGAETGIDIAVGVLGLALVLEATRRTVGWALPILAIVFLVYTRVGPWLPDLLFPHRGYGVERVVSQTFLHSQGVFGTALRVMFVYVFLFVVFGALLEKSGASAFVIDRAQRLFAGARGAPAKVSVLASGLMGSLSGSAVANTATTGTFTIPLMMRTGFKPHIAAAVEAAASSGGALVPPVMGAGAYMMLELVDPPVTYLAIIQAALIPAILYYLALFLVVHLLAQRAGREAAEDNALDKRGDSGTDADVVEAAASEHLGGKRPGLLEGVIFFGGLTTLLALLFAGFTVFRAVSVAMVTVVALAALSPRTRLGWRRLVAAATQAAFAGVALIVAASAVGIVLGVVTLTGIGSKLPAAILPLAQDNLFLALILLMVSSIVLGMGLPSAVCYLLLATLIGPALGGMGVPPLAAHFFIFYFGLMSMVTPPVALAAYTAASIAGSKIMRTAVAAFRYALVGFLLPFLFVYRPALLLLAPDGGAAAARDVVVAVAVSLVGIVAVVVSAVGYGFGPIGTGGRLVAMVIGLALLAREPVATIGDLGLTWIDIAAAIALVALGTWRYKRHPT